MKHWQRISLMLTAVACLAFLTVGCGNDDGKEVLNIYSWADYYDPEVLAEFEKKYNCRVNYDVYSNNEELLAKLPAGGAQFDIIQPSDYMVTTMIKLGMLEKLDQAALPNTKSLIQGLRTPEYDPQHVYSVPYVWGLTGIAYNKRYVKEPPTSWRDLWKPEYKGHVLLLNDSREVFSLALKQLGYSNNSTDKGQVEEAFRTLKDLNQNVLAYDTENNKQKMIAEEVWIAQMWSGDASYVNTENPSVSFVVPKEGTVIWADNMCIPKGAKHKKLAQTFINFMYDPDISARNFNYMRLPNANAAAIPKMDPAIAGNPILQYAETKASLGEWLRDIGDAITFYDQLWTELKTGK
ncbi:MAG: ABC transporter substrate-binding protein [Succiniclasticum sp.]